MWRNDGQRRSSECKRDGLKSCNTQKGRIIIVDPKLSERSINEIVAKAQKGLGPPKNKTIWQNSKDDMVQNT